MLEISKNANPNYLAKIFRIEQIRKHKNADRLQIVTLDYEDIVTGMDTKKGQIYVYFPVECKINKDFLSFTNSFRDKELNKDKDQVGFFEKHGRVKAIKLRGEKSMGYIVPLHTLSEFLGKTFGNIEDILDKEFDTINGVKLLSKYVPKGVKTKSSKAVEDSRLVDNQVRLHVDTLNLRKHIKDLKLFDTISITYKTHGTSWWCGNLKVKKKLSWYNRILKYNQEDLWKDIKDSLVGKIPKGFTLYGECIGYTKNGREIQKDYDYGCKFNEFKLQVYRITRTNEDGYVTELNHNQIVDFCNKYNLTPVSSFYNGTVLDYLKKNEIDHLDNFWKDELLKHLEKEYNEKDCYMCNNKVPEEGIVLRVENLFECRSYKLKSFRFLQKETKELDNA